MSSNQSQFFWQIEISKKVEKFWVGFKLNFIKSSFSNHSITFSLIVESAKPTKYQLTNHDFDDSQIVCWKASREKYFSKTNNHSSFLSIFNWIMENCLRKSKQTKTSTRHLVTKARAEKRQLERKLSRQTSTTFQLEASNQKASPSRAFSLHRGVIVLRRETYAVRCPLKLRKKFTTFFENFKLRQKLYLNSW